MVRGGCEGRYGRFGSHVALLGCAWRRLSELHDKRQQIQALQMLALFLPEANRSLAAVLLNYLSQVAQHSKMNKMDAGNLAVCLAPTLFRDSRCGGAHVLAHPLARPRHCNADPPLLACHAARACVRAAREQRQDRQGRLGKGRRAAAPHNPGAALDD